MRRDRKRKGTKENREYILAVMHRRIEHSCYKNRPRVRPYYSEATNRKAMDWDVFLDRFLINVLWNEEDIRDKVYRGARLVFKTEDNRIYVADTNKKVLYLNGESAEIPLNKDLVWDFNYLCLFKFPDIVGNHYYDGSGTV